MIRFLARDLILTGKVTAQARARNREIAVYSALEPLLTDIRDSGESGESGDTVLVDLQLPGLDPGELVTAIRGKPGAIRVVAYAQHLRTDLLEAARTAGVDQVLTRGQFDRQIAELVSGTTD